MSELDIVLESYRDMINRIPDTWEPSTVWYLAAAETVLEAFVVSLVLSTWTH